MTMEPEIPERLKDEKLEKKLKKVVKEGGKRGVEIEGAADMGGLQFFCTAVDEPAGDIDMLVESMKAMNAKSNPEDEERKGGSGAIGKMISSMDDDNFCLVAYVPEAKLGEIKAGEWLKEVLTLLGVGELREGSNDVYAVSHIPKDSEKGVFPMKLRDGAISHGIACLRKRGLFPEDKDDSDDDFVFGDEDFPS